MSLAAWQLHGWAELVVWLAAPQNCMLGVLCCCVLCRELLAHPEIFRGQTVLELGSGTGLVGLVAALAGAQQVGGLVAIGG